MPSRSIFSSTGECLRRVDEPFLDLVDGDAQRRPRAALAGARLQQVQAPVLDGEFELLHVVEFLLEPGGDARELLAQRRQDLAQACRVGRAVASGDDVLALRVEEEVEVELRSRRSRGRA